MIKDGNYYYLNFDEHKEKFIDVFTEYYGSEFAETIRNRINSITYVPYMKFDYVSSYYGKLMDKYKDEIIAEFKKISGHDVKKEDEDLIWKDGGSSIFASEIDGHNLENCDFLFEVKNEYLAIRDKVTTALGLDKSADLVEQFKCEARNLKKALAEVEKRHPCQVFNDVERGIRNRNDSLQKFLVNVNKYFLNLSEHDIELINSPNFDTYDREDLNSKYLMFGTTIEEPGLIKYFTSESEETIKNGDIDDKITINEGRVRFMALNSGYEHLKHVTIDELYGKTEIKDKDDYLKRLIQEQINIAQIEPEGLIPPAVADKVEECRLVFSRNLYVGCQMIANLSNSYQGTSHNVENVEEWFTCLEFERQKYDQPINVIYFNENQSIKASRLISNLIHEINHAVGHGKAVLDKNKKLAVSKSGIIEFLRVVYNGEDLGEYVAGNEDILNIGEDYNERMAREQTEMFLSKYPNVFDDADVELKYEENWHCAYDFFNFMTDKSWEQFADVIKRYRLLDDVGIYYDVDKRQAFGLREYAVDTIKYVYNKHFNPKKLSTRGEINSIIFQELGALIEEFKDNLLPCLYDLEIKPTDLQNRDDFSDLPNMTDEINEELKYYKQTADEITDRLFNDRLDLIDRVDRQLLRERKYKRFRDYILNKSNNLSKPNNHSQSKSKKSSTSKSTKKPTQNKKSKVKNEIIDFEQISIDDISTFNM